MAASMKQRLAAGENLTAIMLGPMATPKMVEMVARHAQVDVLWLDQEHSALTHQQLEHLLTACRAADIEAFVRLAPLDYCAIMRPMEAGAAGVMVAQIRTVEQVEQVVQWAKFSPMGIRGLFGTNHESNYGVFNAAEHVAERNEKNWVGVQIETPESVECAEEIARVDGVDTLFVGPGDLACTLGVPGQPLHEKCVDALRKVSSAVKAAGKSWSVLAVNPEHAAVCRQLGCQMINVASESMLMLRGMKATREEYAALFD